MMFLAGSVVVAFAVFLMALAVAAFARPVLVRRFLGAFASSASAHYAEQAVRLAVGSSLVVFAPAMGQPGVFRLAGWAIIVTTLGLLCVPWRWHRRFARAVVPPVLEHPRLFGCGAGALGLLLLCSGVAGDWPGSA